MSVMDYLIAMSYEPTLGWDPLTGHIVQFLPANRSAKALKNARGGVETNRLGDVHVQIEAFFTPGMVVNGVKYDQLTDTPMLGLKEILAWLDALGIPRTWATPRGSRNVNDWLKKPGHRAHYNVPENDHTDIVGADTTKLLMLNKPIDSPTTPGDIVMDQATSNAIRAIVQEELRTVLGNPNSDTDKDKTHYALGDVQRDLGVLTARVTDLADQFATFVQNTPAKE